MKKDVTKDIKESCNRLGFEKGPWSSWLTQFEAKRRFPHAEEIAGSNPAGPTTNHLLGSLTFLDIFSFQRFSRIFRAVSSKSFLSGFSNP